MDAEADLEAWHVKQDEQAQREAFEGEETADRDRRFDAWRGARDPQSRDQTA